MYQDNNTTVPKSETWTASLYQCCTNRLPCGVCRLMQIMCPLSVKPYDVTWKNPYEVTCKAEVQE